MVYGLALSLPQVLLILLTDYRKGSDNNTLVRGPGAWFWCVVLVRVSRTGTGRPLPYDWIRGTATANSFPSSLTVISSCFIRRYLLTILIRPTRLEDTILSFRCRLLLTRSFPLFVVMIRIFSG